MATQNNNKEQKTRNTRGDKNPQATTSSKSPAVSSSGWSKGLKKLFHKLLEHEFLTLLAKLIIWFFTIIGGAATGIVQWIDISADHPVLLYAKSHPERISIVLMAIALFSPVIVGLVSGLVRLISIGALKLMVILELHEHETAEPVANISNAETLVQAMGISGFSPHTTKQEKRADWKSCNDKIKSNRAIDLRIMGATGWNTFGHKDAPLYRLLDQFQGEIKILLIKPDPTLPALIQRANEIGVPAADYVQEINNSIDRLKALKAKGKNISLKLYEQMPIWKMVISNDYMWLQHYCKCKNVEDTPVYSFFSDGDEGTSLFHALYSVWLKRWDIDGNPICIL